MAGVCFQAGVWKKPLDFLRKKSFLDEHVLPLVIAGI